MSARVAVLIGNKHSTGAPGLSALDGTSNDVRELIRILGDPEIGGFEVHPVLDAPASETLELIERGLRRCGRDGLFLFYYAGWGVLDTDERLYLASADSRLDQLSSTAISAKFLRHLLEYSVCEQSVVILDCCFSAATRGRLLPIKISDQLRRLRAKGGATVAVLASSPRVLGREKREDVLRGRPMGSLTRLLAEGLSSGAADRDRNGEVTVGEMGEFLGSRMPDLCPSWLADAAGDALVLGVCTAPTAEVDELADVVSRGSRLTAAAAGTGRKAPNWWWSIVLVGLAVTISAVPVWLHSGAVDWVPAPRIRRDELASLDLPGPGMISEHLLMRQLAANSGWVEHPIGSWLALEAYPGAELKRLHLGEAGAGDGLRLAYRGEATFRLAEGSYGVGMLWRARLNVGSVIVLLVDGREFRFDVATHAPNDRFHGFLTPVPIEEVRLRGTRGSLEIERLFIYADRQH
jgi:hypothetical protein